MFELSGKSPGLIEKNKGSKGQVSTINKYLSKVEILGQLNPGGIWWKRQTLIK